MPVNWNQLSAHRTERMRASDIREILKITAQPDVISLAGGLPAPELFPIDEYRRAFEWVMETDGAAALQYGPSEGYRPLRDFLAERLTGEFKMPCTAEEILITNGSQQALDLIGRVFLDPGDHVVMENPSYLGAIQAFNQYEAAYTVVPMDEDGMRVDALEGVLAEDRARARPRVKLIYAVPTFQNPTGLTLGLERRKALVEIATRYGVPIIEDNPYGELRYEGEELPSLRSLDDSDTVIYLGTFSKILAPGFRLGWVVAGPQAMELLLHAKQPADLHTGTAAQMATYYVVREGFLETHVQRLCQFYKERRDVMLRSVDAYFPQGARYLRPMGGLFVWVELPTGIDTRDLLVDAVKEKVAFVPGGSFHPDGSGANTLRMNFSNVPPEKIEEGVRRLGLAIQKRLEGVGSTEARVAV